MCTRIYLRFDCFKLTAYKNRVAWRFCFAFHLFNCAVTLVVWIVLGGVLVRGNDAKNISHRTVPWFRTTVSSNVCNKAGFTCKVTHEQVQKLRFAWHIHRANKFYNYTLCIFFVSVFPVLFLSNSLFRLILVMIRFISRTIFSSQFNVALVWIVIYSTKSRFSCYSSEVSDSIGQKNEYS